MGGWQPEQIGNTDLCYLPLVLLRQELENAVDECRLARASGDPRPSGGLPRKRQDAGSSSGSDQKSMSLLTLLARSPPVHCVHAWSGELCAAAVARMEAACGL